MDNKDSRPPLVGGGQGRSDEEIQKAADKFFNRITIGLLLLITVCAILLALDHPWWGWLAPFFRHG